MISANEEIFLDLFLPENPSDENISRTGPFNAPTDTCKSIFVNKFPGCGFY
jgi:hypothetical protein